MKDCEVTMQPRVPANSRAPLALSRQASHEFRTPLVSRGFPELPVCFQKLPPRLTFPHRPDLRRCPQPGDRLPQNQPACSPHVVVSARVQGCARPTVASAVRAVL